MKHMICLICKVSCAVYIKASTQTVFHMEGGGSKERRVEGKKEGKIKERGKKEGKKEERKGRKGVRSEE